MASNDSKTILDVVKFKTDAQGRKHSVQVGKIVLRDNGNGTLFLHFLDGDFALFPKRDGEGSAREA